MSQPGWHRRDSREVARRGDLPGIRPRAVLTASPPRAMPLLGVTAAA